MNRVLAIDLGASSGRAILVNYEDKKITLTEIHRFQDYFYQNEEGFFWNIKQIFEEIKKSIYLAAEKGEFDSVAIDTWGVDIGLLDEKGELLADPRHYRDTLHDNELKRLESILSKEKLYQETGISILEINTLFQLTALKHKKRDLYDKIDKILLIPDLLNYMLTGIKKEELSIASTTQLLDPVENSWHFELIEKLGLKKSFFSEIVTAGTVIGTLDTNIFPNLSGKKVISVCSHDTASAIVSIPAQTEDYLFLSAGTWSLMGIEVQKPIISQDSYRFNLTNEKGYQKEVTFLKNITGLWILQEVKRDLEKDGQVWEYSKIVEAAQMVTENKVYIDPDYDEFMKPGNMIEKIKRFVKETQNIDLVSNAEIFRCVYESLALKYRQTYEEICLCIGKRPNTLHIIGGGVQAKILCQYTANALGINVVAGPIEATAIGNGLVQLISSQTISSLKEGREIVLQSFQPDSYLAEDDLNWNLKYQKYQEIMKH